jgi:putative two-component system response regulator
MRAMAVPEPERTGPRVLVVEDDPETRRFYIGILEDAGFIVEQAHNGLQALDKARLTTPDLVLTDIAVPGLDGIGLCRALRLDARTRDVPVLAVTGYGERHYDNRARQAGANRILLKPLDPDILVAEARELLAHHHA